MTNYAPLSDRATLAERVTHINYLFDRETKAQIELNRRDQAVKEGKLALKARGWEAGLELLAVQKIVPAGEWKKWCSDNIHQSYSQIKRAMKWATQEDPAAAQDEENAQRRGAYRNDTEIGGTVPHVDQSQRSTRPHLSLVDPTLDPVEEWLATFRAFGYREQQRAIERLDLERKNVGRNLSVAG